MTKFFTVDAGAILTLGRDSIKDHTTALVELVKNGYDADATRVEVDIYIKSKPPYIRIADNGVGMTESQVGNNWLRIGYSEKKIKKVSQRKRRKTGEKGIGRISADRLGATLELRTKAKRKVYGLKVNWNDFAVSRKELSKVLIEEIPRPDINIPPPPKERPDKSGTELIITQLRQRWNEQDIQTLQRELSMLVSPFSKLSDFETVLNTDVATGYSGKIESEIQETAFITLTAKFDGKSKVTYTLTDPKTKASGKTEEQHLPLAQFLHKTARQKSTRKQKTAADSPDNDGANLECGPVELTLMFFPQKKELLTGTGFSLSDLKRFLNNNAGVRIYRDNIRVKPYGDPKELEGDWLKLGAKYASNPASASRETFNLSPKQVVGAVFVGRDTNPKLVDSSSREGLVHGEAFSDLRRFVVRCADLIRDHYHRIFIEANPRRDLNPVRDVKLLGKELVVLQRDLRSIAPMLVRSARENVDDTIEHLNAVVAQIRQAQPSLTELQNQAINYRGLATIGIAATVFAHETESSITGFLGSADTAISLLEVSPPRVDEALEELKKSEEFANKVSGWGAFALSRIQREKRQPSEVDVEQLAGNVIKELRPTLEAATIDVQLKSKSVKGTAFAMDIEAVLINLLTNAYAACKQVVKRKRIIRVEVAPKAENGSEGVEIIVADSGPGVAKQYKDKIWDALFTTRTDDQKRPVGTGLGLTIVRSILEDSGGSRNLDSDPELKGARFTIWFPLT